MGNVTREIPESDICWEAVVIFVAVGTTDFDGLVQGMDEMSLNMPEEIIIQIGRSSYIPQYCRYFRFAPSLEPYYDRASLVISHGGLGIVTEVLGRKCPLVALENPNQPDRHQREILRVWEQEGYLIWCKDLNNLPEAMEKAKGQLTPYNPPTCQIHIAIEKFLEEL